MPKAAFIPPLFLDRMSRFLCDEYPAFAEVLNHAPVHGLRVNTLKLNPEGFRKISPFPLGDVIPWCNSAFLLDEDEKPGRHPYHKAGLYYLQDPSAMSVAQILDPQPGERVLDLAAAPGGKTTHIAALMQGQGLLVANEIKTNRLNHLVANVERWGAANTVVINEAPERLADHFSAFFDRVLVDAPCSGEGMFRKDVRARFDWSLEMVEGCAIRQTNIMRVAAHLVRPGGHLLYSTCTFAPEEDEGVMAKFLKEHPNFEVVSIPHLYNFMPGLSEWASMTAARIEEEKHLENPEKNIISSLDSRLSIVNESLDGAVRLYPHRLSGEGQFACLMRRKDDEADDLTIIWKSEKIPTPLWQTWQGFQKEYLSCDFPSGRLHLQGNRLYFTPEEVPELKGLRVTAPGVWLGNFKKDRFEPAHPLAMFLRKEQAKNVLSLPAESKEIASYLRGEIIGLDAKPGWNLICADNFPLGWGKHVQGVLKNHYPKGWMV